MTRRNPYTERGPRYLYANAPGGGHNHQPTTIIIPGGRGLSAVTFHVFRRRRRIVLLLQLLFLPRHSSTPAVPLYARFPDVTSVTILSHCQCRFSTMPRASSKRTPAARTRNELSSARFANRDTQVVLSILKEFGIDEYDPQIVNQLLEFNYRYSTTLLDDAKTYSRYAKKKNIDADDVQIAVQMTQEAVISKSVSREVLMSTSREVNKIPLPLIKPMDGLRIPHDCTSLQTDYSLKPDMDSERNVFKINTITTAAEILEESRKQEIDPCDEFINDSIDFDLQDIINQLDCNDGIEEYVKDELLEFQPFENHSCFDMELGNINEREWPNSE